MDIRPCSHPSCDIGLPVVWMALTFTCAYVCREPGAARKVALDSNGRWVPLGWIKIAIEAG